MVCCTEYALQTKDYIAFTSKLESEEQTVERLKFSGRFHPDAEAGQKLQCGRLCLLPQTQAPSFLTMPMTRSWVADCMLLSRRFHPDAQEGPQLGCGRFCIILGHACHLHPELAASWLTDGPG